MIDSSVVEVDDGMRGAEPALYGFAFAKYWSKTVTRLEP
jgi:hypothetical protein